MEFEVAFNVIGPTLGELSKYVRILSNLFKKNIVKVKLQLG